MSDVGVLRSGGAGAVIEARMASAWLTLVHLHCMRAEQSALPTGWRLRSVVSPRSTSLRSDVTCF